jgi:hypothetical protein
MTSQPKIILSAEDRASAVLASVGRNVDKLGFNFDTLKASAIAGLGALAVPVSVAGIASVFNESRRAIDGLKDLADASGASVGAISALDNIARMTGGNLDTVSSILVKFNGVLAEARPDKGVGATLGLLNLNIEELKRLDPAEALRVTAVAVEQLGSETDKARVYQELFGKSVRDAAPFLKDLAEAKRLDAQLTDDQVEQMDRFNKEMAKLQASAGNAARTLSITVAGALNTVIDRFKQGQKEGKNFWQIALEGYKKDVGALYGAAPSGGIAPGRVSSGTIIDASDPRAALRRMEREQDTRPNASIFGATPSAGSSAVRAGSGAGRAGLSEAEKARQAYDDFQKKAAADLDAYLVRRHEKRLDEEAAIEKRYIQDVAQFDQDAQDYVYKRNVKRWEDEQKEREELARKATDAQAAQTQRLGDAFANTFGRAFDEGMKLGDLIKRLAFDAINIQFLTPAAQKAGSFLGNAVTNLFKSFDGGGYTGSGSRSGGIDGKGGFLSVLHPNETVLDHTRGQGVGGGGTAVIQQTFNFGNATGDTVAQLRAEAARIKAETLAAVPAAMVQAVRTSTGVARAMRGG